MADEYKIKGDERSVLALRSLINREINDKTVERAAISPRRKAGRTTNVFTRRFVLTTEWEREQETDSYWAIGNPVIEDGDSHVESPSDEEVRIVYPDIDGSMPSSTEGEQVYATFRGGRWELLEITVEDEPVGPKELFPVIYYKKYRKDENGDYITDEKGKRIFDHYLICPGGNTSFGPTRRIYSLNLETRKWSGSEFGSLPIAMSNFGAVLITNKYGEQELVCGSGYTTQTSNNTLQFYNFDQDAWRDSVFEYNFQGCPLFWDGKLNSNGDAVVVILGGQGAYYENKNDLTGYITHTMMWEINVTAGTVETQLPRRGGQYNSVYVDREKRFLKTNFGAIRYHAEENEGNVINTVDYIAFGGTETVSAYNNSVISYRNGGFVNTEAYASYDRPANLRTIEYPDTTEALGECCVEYVDRVSNGNGNMVDAKRVLCIGGRRQVEITEKDENGNEYTKLVLEPHEKIHWLQLVSKQWYDDFFPEVPIPRWNSGSILLKDFERTIVLNEEEVEEFGVDPELKIKNEDLLFLIGGRTNEGLIGEVDVLNMTTNEWEVHWPNFNNKIRAVLPTAFSISSISIDANKTLKIRFRCVGGSGYLTLDIFAGNSKNPASTATVLLPDQNEILQIKVPAWDNGTGVRARLSISEEEFLETAA